MDDKKQKEKMIETFASIWKHASDNEIKWIQKIWKVILKSAKIIKWEKIDKTDEYQLELEKELVGTHPDIPLGQLILKKIIEIDFSEEKIKQTNGYKQVMAFSNQGVCHRLGIGWLSKEIALKSLSVEENASHDILFTIEGLGQNISKPADFILDFWNKIEWKE